MRKLFPALFVFLVFSAQIVFAEASPLSLRLINECNFTSDFGNPVNTYEDVDPITTIGPRADNSGPMIKHVEINAFNIPVKAETGQALIDKINQTDGRVLYDPGFLNFMKKYMYIESGGYDEKREKWYSGKIVRNFPTDYDPGTQPHMEFYYLCLSGGWYYIPPVSYPPDAKSCDVKRDLCDYPPCIKEEKDDDDDDGDGDTNETIQDEEHHQPTNNVYRDLAAYLYGRVIPGSPVERDESGKVFTMTFSDRTPPRILGCTGGMFPEIGADEPATTGDWYQVKGLKISDNSTGYVGTCLCLGKIDGAPSKNWAENAEWVKEQPFLKVKSGEDSQHIIMPNSCHGVMQYSIFAWDENGLLNPGDPGIIEDSPETCYGLSSPPTGSEDLERAPDTAKPWPLTVSFSGSVESASSDSIDPGLRRGMGLLNIVDNDLPNIVIKLTSVRDGRTVFFPPVIQPLDLPILSSTEYKKSAGLENANAKDYETFIGDPTKAIFTSELIDKKKGLYFKVLDMKPSSVMFTDEHPLLERITDPKSTEDYEFICSQLRLEDYQESDTDTSGNPILNDPETLGKRTGTGGEITALLEGAVQEDVEYLISVWVDDNVKWATKDESGTVLTEIISVPTGVKEGEINVVIPNQVPSVNLNLTLDTNNSVSDEFRVVFREPTTDSSKLKGSGDFQGNKFPFIEVTAKDFSGLTRKIKLFVAVTNENPDIRIIERQHQKR